MLYILEMFRKYFSPSEAKLRAMYRLGVQAGRKQLQDEQEQTRKILPLALPVHTVVALPVQQPLIQEPIKEPLTWKPIPIHTGALSKAYARAFAIPPRPGKRLAHLPPAQRERILFASRLTATDVPVVKDWPDAG